MRTDYKYTHMVSIYAQKNNLIGLITHIGQCGMQKCPDMLADTSPHVERGRYYCLIAILD